MIFKDMTDSHYNKDLKHFAQTLRTHSTPGEIILWDKVLKNKQMHGYQFLRQHAIDNYIVDFVCRKIKLVIEVDGYSHNFKFEKDKERDEYLSQLGFTVIRFTENEIKNEHYVLKLNN